jgi:hypothetical protein
MGQALTLRLSIGMSILFAHPLFFTLTATAAMIKRPAQQTAWANRQAKGWFCKQDVDINAVDQYGYTALMKAAQTASTHEVIESLLDQGSNLTLKTRLGNTIFSLGIEVNNYPCMKRYFQTLQEYQKEIAQEVERLAQLPNFPKELCLMICLYTSNAYHPKKKS